MTETQTKSKLEQIREKIDLNRGLVKFDYAKVRDNQDLTQEAKLRKLEGIYAEGQEKHKRLLQEAEAERVRVKTEARQKLTQAPIPEKAKGSDREIYMMSLRDAMGRTNQTVAAAKEPAAVLKLLYERAVATGDELLKFAIFRRAIEAGFGISNPVVRSYLEEKELEEAFRIANTGDADIFERAFDRMGTPRPVELMNRPDMGRVRGIA
jgi:hypothetical protein